jgi:hypothetical protein
MIFVDVSNEFGLLDSISNLRSYHSASVCIELSILSRAVTRRLERHTLFNAIELQKLWNCFIQHEPW